MSDEITLREHLTRIGSLGGKAKAKPTPCPRCGEVQPTARGAWLHCLNLGARPRKGAAKKAAGKKAPTKKAAAKKAATRKAAKKVTRKRTS